MNTSVSKNNFINKTHLILIFCCFYLNIFSQNEFELNFNFPIFPIGDYSSKKMNHGIERVGFAKIGYGIDFKFLHQLKNSKFKIGLGVNYLQNPYNTKKLNDIEYQSQLFGCPDIILCSNDSTRFSWDKMTSISDWKNIDLNFHVGFNVLKIKKLQYNAILGIGGTTLFSPKFKFNKDSIEGVVSSKTSFSFNLSTDQNLKFKLIEKLYINVSLVYRVSKVYSKFTKNLVEEEVYFDFWQHTVSTKLGLVYIVK